MKIPKQVKFVIEQLKNHGFEAYIVGGCVRDFLIGNEPLDWDITTNAKPEQIGSIFLKSYADNKFGTVTVQAQIENHNLKIKSKKNQNPEFLKIEITPYRIETKYTDKRHPDEIKWAKTIEQDLGRRDFTVNAMAATFLKPELKNENEKLKIIDLFNGQKDLKNKIIRAVGEPDSRFLEDGLRLIRAVRFTAVLQENKSDLDQNVNKTWKIEQKTLNAIKKNAGLIKFISKERIRDEFMKIIMSQKPEQGIELLRELGLLKYIIPELEETYGVKQNKHHIYEVYKHLLFSLKYAAKKNFNKYVRLSALFHDIGKPRTKRGTGLNATFYNHEIVSARMTARIMNYLRFPKKDIEKTVKLVRYHLFYYNVNEVGEASVRRLVRQVGKENMEELIQLRMCDRIGSGVPKAEPYKLRYMKYIIEKVSQDPISVKMLKVNGKDIMKILKIKQGIKIGQILDILLGYVLSDPEKNEREFLQKQIDNLGRLSESELKKISEQAKETRKKIIIKQDEMTKNKYWLT